MTIERKKLDYSALIRMMRAATGLHQAQAAQGAGLALRTLQMAEAGNCSAKTFAKMAALYAQAGIQLCLLPGLNGEPVSIIAFDQDIAPDI